MFNRRIPKVCLVHVAAAENEWSGAGARRGRAAASFPTRRRPRRSGGGRPLDGSREDEGLGRDGEAADEGRVVVEDAGECVVEEEGDVRRVGEGDALTALSRRVWAELET